MKSKKSLITIGSSIAIVLILFFVFKSGGESRSDIIVNVQKGSFRVEVNTTGELEARNSKYILGPTNLRRYRIYQVNVQNIIPEGTYVKKGQFVASLDASELNNRIKDSQLSLEDKDTKFLQTKLDTALQMREARDKLYNLEFAVQEKQLILDQSKFEPPATIKKAEIDLEKAIRQLSQEKENYKIKKKQNVAKIQIAGSASRKERKELDDMIAVQSEFNILAPEDGMLIYRKGWDGKPIKAGSQIGTWDPIVATLPDLSTMNSITYVNEVDIRRIKKGQFVEVGLDAFPEKAFNGKVTQVANVGEQRPNSDSKVFKVVVEIDKIDDSLRPGMTTGNNIITSEIDSTLYIPLESLHSYQDSITYVYVESGLGYSKREVLIGETNGDAAQVLLGIDESNRVYLSQPEDSDEPIKLLSELNGKRNKPQQEPDRPEPHNPRGELGKGKPSF
ncbi:MAG: efflux RND transporter periplasmic adaptor subunit [Cyclobacteriaceae bacterium]